MYNVKLSVRTLVEYVFRSGSIESGFQTTSALVDGTKAHQKIQTAYGAKDQKEVHMKTEIPFEELLFQIEGRCDGLLMDEDGTITIDEIKSIAGSLEQITANTYPVHWAQAIFYAFIYAKDHEHECMNIQLTYVHVKTEVLKKFQRMMTIQQLEAFVMDVVSRYASYAKVLFQHVQNRNRTTKELAFPFAPYRKGQRKLAGAVYKTILDKKVLFAKASTGIGKTISTIFPAVKAIGEGYVERIFYLTAKTITRTAAENTFHLLREKGLDLKVVTITAKDKICFQEETICDKLHCPFADGYYNRINGAILDIFQNESLMTRQVIEMYAKKHRVCPFEFSLDLAYAADVVICDYNYIFDPTVSLQRLFEEQKKKTVLLVDEAHNLVDRAREMYSAKLQKSMFLELMRSYKDRNKQISEAAKAINIHLLNKKKKDVYLEKNRDDELIELVDSFVFEAEEELQRDVEVDEHLLDSFFSAQAFVKIARLYDERFITYMEIDHNEVSIKLFCLDPSHLLRQFGKGFRAKVFFSATLIPGDYYKNLLGGAPGDYVISIPSPFAREKVEVIIQPLSTRFRDRDRTIGPMVQFINQLLEKHAGNFLVFFPSYKYMQAVYEQFVKASPNVETIIQDAGMSEERREDFLSKFQPDRAERIVGFAVLGGIFSEGVDLKGNRLQGVIIVGVGLPQIGLERDIMKEYFNQEGLNGYDYAYVYPGMNKVLQAGGRLIRTDSDQGVIVLIDDRFLQTKYKQLLPYEWQHFQVKQ